MPKVITHEPTGGKSKMSDDNLIIPSAFRDPSEELNGLMNSVCSLNEEQLLHTADRMMDFMLSYKNLKMVYSCAIREVKTKFEVLNTEFSVRYQRNPINFISSRLKSNQSIMEKLNRKQLPLTAESIQKHVLDVAGIRIICSYVDDIYALGDALLRQDDVTLIQKKDYIENPKANGYRSLHLIISVPVFLADEKHHVPVEVQIRTIAMDFWATLEHQMKYKQVWDGQQDTVNQLHACAEKIAVLDQEMLQIRTRIDAVKENHSQEDELMQKLRRMEIPIC